MSYKRMMAQQQKLEARVTALPDQAQAADALEWAALGD